MSAAQKFRGRDLESGLEAQVGILEDSAKKGSVSLLSHFATNRKAIFLIFQAKLYFKVKGPVVWLGFYVSLVSCMAADHSLEPLELVTYQEGTEENWFSYLLLREVRWRAHSGVPDSEPGPDSLYSNQFPGDADTAGVGTSFEELLDESTLP